MQEELGQRDINSVTEEALDTRSVISFPLRIDGQWDFDRPAREGAGGKQDCVSDRFVPLAAPVEHAREHWDVEIGVVEDADLFLVVMKAMETPDVLGDGAAP